MNLKGVEFEEEQQLNIFIRVICAVSALFVLGGVYISFTQDPMLPSVDLLGLVIAVTLTLVVLIYVFQFTLLTTINTVGIKVKCWPVEKEFLWSDIAEMEVLNYGFIGGWGIRLWTKYGTVYNAKGKIGVAIKLKTGKRFLIGTQKTEELKRIVEKWKSISS